MKKNLLLFGIILAVSSCSSFKQKESSIIVRPKYGKKKYSFVENEEKYILKKESGFVSKGKKFVVKRKLFAKEDKNELERSISISKIGVLRGQIPVFRPEISQYSVWFDGNKYSNQIRINTEKKSLDIEINNPDQKNENENGKKQTIKFPKGTGVYCFFSQLVECVSFTGFIEKAIKKKSGAMNFHIVWDGYPFFQEQYPGIPNELFSVAELSFDGENAKKEIRFSLNIDQQTIFYLFDRKGKFSKRIWVSQGQSILPYNHIAQ